MPSNHPHSTTPSGKSPDTANSLQGQTWNPDGSGTFAAADGPGCGATHLIGLPAQLPGEIADALPGEGALLQGERYLFRLGRPVGSGGMGTVYLAETVESRRRVAEVESASAVEGRAEPPRQVAIKFFKSPAGSDPGVLLKRELSAVRALRHDRIPQVYDWSTNPPIFFAAFHYYPAGSLSDEIGRVGWLEAPAAWRLLEDLLSALTAAHRACILHLDVKPGNVLCDGAGGYLLSDFGISQGRLVSRSMVSTGLGAPVYQSPEQRRGDHESFDARTDLWGVGITLWTALTGARASDLRDLRAACTQGTHGLPPPSAFRPGCSPRLEKLLMPLLATEPENRPGGAAEVLAAVRREIGGSEESSARLPLSADDSHRRRELFDLLMDPLWRGLFRNGNLDSHLVRYMPGQEICREGAERYETYVLLQGTVTILRGGRVLATESREGTFLGEVTALTGTRRTASMVAGSEVWAAVFNPAELERFVTRHPAVAIRLIKVLADRVYRESQWGNEGSGGGKA